MRRKALPVAPVSAEVGSGCSRDSLACRERERAGLSKPPKPQSQQKGFCLWDKPPGECPRDPELKEGMGKCHSELLQLPERPHGKYTCPVQIGKARCFWRQSYGLFLGAAQSDEINLAILQTFGKEYGQ